MNCETCQNFLSEYLDNELESELHLAVQTHISLCQECAEIYEDFAVILDSCPKPSEKEIAAPNAQAMWCEINSKIEKDATERRREIAESKRKGGWHFSFKQVAASFLGIALVSSLLTFVFIHNKESQPTAHFAASGAPPSLFDRVLGKLGFIETPEQIRAKRIEEQKRTIEYWNNRVAIRRQMWDAGLRAAFDRNLNEIDKAVTDYTMILEQNPEDDLSSEMLDSAMTEKVELLREFSEL